MRHAMSVGILALGMVAFNASVARAQHQIVSAPQGYIRIDQALLPTGPNQAVEALTNVEFSLVLDGKALETRGSFWANQFTFLDSQAALPINHQGGLQGGYFGLQTKLDGTHQAIASVWWATEAKTGDGVQCRSGVEAWYADDKPFDPPITDVTKSDPARKLAGGPFRSCQLPLKLSPGTKYTLRLKATHKGRVADGGHVWTALIEDGKTRQVRTVGVFSVPERWRGLNKDLTGFVEQFGPMPGGCSSIPSSTMQFFPAQANGGSHIGKPVTSAYGACRDEVVSRYKIIESRTGGSVTVAVD